MTDANVGYKKLCLIVHFEFHPIGVISLKILID